MLRWNCLQQALGITKTEILSKFLHSGVKIAASRVSTEVFLNGLVIYFWQKITHIKSWSRYHQHKCSKTVSYNPAPRVSPSIFLTLVAWSSFWPNMTNIWTWLRCCIKTNSLTQFHHSGVSTIINVLFNLP